MTNQQSRQVLLMQLKMRLVQLLPIRFALLPNLEMFVPPRATSSEYTSWMNVHHLQIIHLLLLRSASFINLVSLVSPHAVSSVYIVLRCSLSSE